MVSSIFTISHWFCVLRGGLMSPRHEQNTAFNEITDTRSDETASFATFMRPIWWKWSTAMCKNSCIQGLSSKHRHSTHSVTSQIDPTCNFLYMTQEAHVDFVKVSLVSMSSETIRAGILFQYGCSCMNHRVQSNTGNTYGSVTMRVPLNISYCKVY